MRISIIRATGLVILAASFAFAYVSYRLNANNYVAFAYGAGLAWLAVMVIGAWLYTSEEPQTAMFVFERVGMATLHLLLCLAFAGITVGAFLLATGRLAPSDIGINEYAPWALVFLYAVVSVVAGAIATIAFANMFCRRAIGRSFLPSPE